MTPEYITKDTLKETLIDWSCDASYIEVETKWALEEIKNIPAADVAPIIHAEWLAFSDPVLKTKFSCYCSNCHEKSIWRYPYCPGCGARMDKGE